MLFCTGSVRSVQAGASDAGGEVLVGAAFSKGVDLLFERQAEQPELGLDPELEALLPF